MSERARPLSSDAPRRRQRRAPPRETALTSGSWKALIGLFVLTMGTSILTPLLPLYLETYDLSTGTGSLLFVTYTLTVAPTMLIAGNLSDRFGRKWLLLPAMAVMTVASLTFALSDSVAMLFAGRVLQGLAIGGFLGVGAAFVVDHARLESKALAATLAGVFFRLGFGLGPGLGGIVAEYGSDPLHQPFWGHIVLMVIGIVAVSSAAETLLRRPHPGPFRIRIGVPVGQKTGFLTFVAPSIFLMSYLEGTVLSLVPIYMVEELGVTNIAIVGAVGFLVLGLGGVSPFVARRFDPRTAIMIGVSSSTVFSLLIIATSRVNSAGLVVLAAALIGATNGFILYGGTVICGTIVPIQERGKLMSLLYVFAYSGTVPVVGLGYLGDGVGLTTALIVFTSIGAILAAFVLAVGRRLFPEVIPHREPDVRLPATGPPTGRAA
jgi:MFS family permease